MTDTPLKGRPTDYTAELALEICARLAEGATLRAVCKADDMPAESTVRRWALEDRGGFKSQYAGAREIGYQSMADELIEIADESGGDVKTDKDGNETLNGEFAARSRLRLDTRKWLLSKALPKVYGDKLAVTGADGGAVEHKIERIERVIVDNPKAISNG